MITGVYSALAPMSRKERIDRTVSAFSSVLKSSRPMIQSELGAAKAREMLAGALSDLLKRGLVRKAHVRALFEDLFEEARNR